MFLNQRILGGLGAEAAGFGDFVEYFHRLHREQIMPGPRIPVWSAVVLVVPKPAKHRKPFSEA